MREIGLVKELAINKETKERDRERKKEERERMVIWSS